MFVEPVVSEALAEPLLPRQPDVMGAVVTVENVDSLHVAHVDQPKPGKVFALAAKKAKGASLATARGPIDVVRAPEEPIALDEHVGTLRGPWRHDNRQNWIHPDERGACLPTEP